MSEIINIDSAHLWAAPPPGVRPQPASQMSTHAPDMDIAEFSVTSLNLAWATEQSSLRIARTRAIRTEIQEGRFETPERINGTVRRLLDVLG